MGLTANELSSYRGPEVQILSPPLYDPGRKVTMKSFDRHLKGAWLAVATKSQELMK